MPPWLHVDDDVIADVCDIVGAKKNEVAVMQTLTANLHLAMASFYRPTEKRWKIMISTIILTKFVFFFDEKSLG